MIFECVVMPGSMSLSVCTSAQGEQVHSLCRHCRPPELVRCLPCRMALPFNVVGAVFVIPSIAIAMCRTLGSCHGSLPLCNGRFLSDRHWTSHSFTHSTTLVAHTAPLCAPATGTLRQPCHHSHLFTTALPFSAAAAAPTAAAQWQQH